MKLRTFLTLSLTILVFQATTFAQNKKGQLESDRFWENFTKGMEWLPTSKSIAAAGVPSPLAIAEDSLNSKWAPHIDQAFDPDVHRIAMISHNRKVFVRKYNARWADEKSKPSSASMAKSLTSLAVGKALCKGSIKSLEDTAETYSNRLTGTSWGKARIRHLLSMSSGSNKPDFSPTGSPTPEVLAETLAKSYDGRMNHEFVSLMNKADARYSASGQQGYYNNLDTEALALLVEDATQEKFIDFFQREVWQAAGAAQDAKWMHNSQGQVLAFSGFNAHPYDWIRLGHYLLEERSKNHCFGDFLREASRQQSRVIVPNGTLPYGYQFWLGCGNTDAFCLAGHGGQRVMMSPSTGLVMYIHATSDASVQPLFAVFRTVLGQTRQ